MGISWPEVAFRDVLLNETRNGIYKEKKFHGSGVKIVNMGELFANPRLLPITMKRVELSTDEKNKFCLLPGDLLFARRSLVAEGAGKCTIVIAVDEPTTFESSIIRARPDPNKLHSLFAYYFFNSPQGKYLLGTIRRQVTIAGITGSDLVRLRVPLLPLPKQQAIAHILGSLDDKIELNRRMNKTLEAIARAIFKSWFIDFDPVIDNALRAGNPIPDSMAERAEIRRQMLDENQPSSSSPLSQKAKDRKYRGSFNFSGLVEVSIDEIHGLFPDSFQDSELGAIPKGWEVKSLGELCEKPQYGFTTSAKEEEVGPKFLRITDINKLPWIEWSNVPWCEITSAEFEKYKLRIGDFLIARMADPGHGVYIDEEIEAVFASYLIRFRPVDLRYGRYLQYWQHSSKYWNLINARKAGTTRFSLNAKDLSAFPVIIPTFPILEAFSVFINPIRQSIVHYVQESMILTSLRDILLPKLISGELRIPDAEKFVEEIVL
jgi:type I restriction enzyme S subunit